MAVKSSPSGPVLANLDGMLAELETIYKDIHSHPELSMQEERTADVAANHLRAVGYEVTTGVGKTGVVGLLRNGEGPTVMLRADMDALPVQEATGLPYASKVTSTDSTRKSVPVMHACGHDMHVTWLIGTAKLFAKARDAWKGTLMTVFQPAEETAQGAQAMIDDGLFKRFPKPDVILGQHVMCMPAGVIGGRIGVTTSAADSLQIKLFGRGAHGSMPEASIDPVVMAAATVLRLQGIVSREVPPTEAAVVTIGVLQAGTKENVIPDEAIIKLNVRTFDEGVRKLVLAAIERIVNAEAEASGAPRKPEITPLDHYSLTTRIRMRPSECGMRFARIFLPTAYRRPSRRWRARLPSQRSGFQSRGHNSRAASGSAPLIFEPQTLIRSRRHHEIHQYDTTYMRRPRSLTAGRIPAAAFRLNFQAILTRSRFIRRFPALAS
jgi:amidohydrolase